MERKICSQSWDRVSGNRHASVLMKSCFLTDASLLENGGVCVATASAVSTTHTHTHCVFVTNSFDFDNM